MSKKTIEEQIAELTEEQKDTILKVDKYGTLIILGATLPGIILVCLGLFLMVDDIASFPIAAIHGMQIIGALICIFTIAAFIFIKKKFPYYSDKKAAYIRKERKGK